MLAFFNGNGKRNFIAVYVDKVRRRLLGGTVIDQFFFAPDNYRLERIDNYFYSCFILGDSKVCIEGSRRYGVSARFGYRLNFLARFYVDNRYLEIKVATER